MEILANGVLYSVMKAYPFEESPAQGVVRNGKAYSRECIQNGSMRKGMH